MELFDEDIYINEFWVVYLEEVYLLLLFLDKLSFFIVALKIYFKLHVFKYRLFAYIFD